VLKRIKTPEHRKYDPGHIEASLTHPIKFKKIVE
jgi:hypothetical protein